MSVPLATLKPGQAGTVVGYRDDTDEVALRLMQMGVVEGTRVAVIRYAPAGDPMEVDVMGYALSLRGAEAALVLVDETD